MTPKDLVEAINQLEEMKGFIGEVYDIDHTCNQAKLWKNAWKAKEGEFGLTPLGRVNEVRYLAQQRSETYFRGESMH